MKTITPHDFASVLKARPAESNKGSYGHVLFVGGSLGKAGSVAMAGIAALRAGAGLSTIATPKSVLATVAGFHPEIMSEPLLETDAGTIAESAQARLQEIMAGKSVVAIGPGISRQSESSNLVRALVSANRVSMVVDADGLNAFEGRTEDLNGRGRSLVITPHPGEMARLAGCTVTEVQKDRFGKATIFARDHEVIVVLKGHRTLVVLPDGQAWVNTTGNAGMATGGTGDILTGMVAGLMAQHRNDTLLATLAAVYLHGLAGDISCETMGEHSLVASDLLRALPEAFRRAASYPVLQSAVHGMQHDGGANRSTARRGETHERHQK